MRKSCPHSNILLIIAVKMKKINVHLSKEKLSGKTGPPQLYLCSIYALSIPRPCLHALSIPCSPLVHSLSTPHPSPAPPLSFPVPPHPSPTHALSPPRPPSPIPVHSPP